jgi:hypothetical protein
MGQARPIVARTSRPHLIPASPLSGTTTALAATIRIAICLPDGRLFSVTCCGGRRHGPRRRSLNGPCTLSAAAADSGTLVIEDDA